MFGVAVFLLSSVARATIPSIAFSEVNHPEFNNNENTMMYEVTVRTGGNAAARAADDTDHDTRVGYMTTSAYNGQGGVCATATGWTNSPVQRFTEAGNKFFRLWNFIPDTSYTYRIDIGPTPGGGSETYECGTLGQPSLPDTLAAINFRFDKNGTPASPYIVAETNDCRLGNAGTRKSFFYAINPTLTDPVIVWYLDQDDISDGKGQSGGFRYQAGTGSTTGRIMAIYADRYLYEFGFDGEPVAPSPVDLATVGVASYACTGTLRSRGPCINHDLFKSDVTGNYFSPATALSSVDAIGSVWEQECGTGALFLNDGFIRQDGVTRSLMKDYGYNPRIDPGPEPELNCGAPTFHNNFNTSINQIEWTHINSAQTDNFTGTEYLELGFKQTDTIIRLLASAPYTKQWSLSSHANDGDFSVPTISVGLTGPATWEDQHDPHFVSTSELMMFDNTGDPRGSRVLRVTVNTTAHTAVINKAWMMMDRLGAAMACPVQGVAEEVPGTSGARVLALCKEETKIAELSDATGAVGTAPPFVMSIRPTACTNESTIDESDLQWNRAFPVSNLGAY